MKRTTGLNAGILIVILLTIITISIFNGCSSTDEIATNIGSVTGVVVDTDGTTVLTGKNVNITGINGTIGIANTTTSVSGVFSYLNIPVGTYTITVTDTDTATTFIASKNVDIIKGLTATMVITKGEVAPPTPTPTATATETPTPTLTPTP